MKWNNITVLIGNRIGGTCNNNNSTPIIIYIYV